MNKTIEKKKYKEKKAVINVRPIVRDTCSVYITKGRINNTASKLITSNKKCIRIAKQLQILEKRFKFL